MRLVSETELLNSTKREPIFQGKYTFVCTVKIYTTGGKPLKVKGSL